MLIIRDGRREGIMLRKVVSPLHTRFTVGHTHGPWPPDSSFSHILDKPGINVPKCENPVIPGLRKREV